ncbi:MAG: rRNA ((1915)-N(3))-methyltransferase RlmH [Chitinophagaceae bacterium]|nr:rRNA ((1915)-N(3))-methyltransferase RlmH [Chitinophagaceae bacterium]
MKISFLSVGKNHEEYIKAGVEDFSNRIEKYFTLSWNIIPSPKNAASMQPAGLKKEESKIILQQLDKDDFLILLDERGKQLSSPELAELLQQKANNSIKRIVFLVGGAYGVDESIMQRAGFQWSLSKLVFPHMLVRLILAEQVYRACTIIRNEKYHHS